MPFREIILTKKLFVIKMGKLKKYHEEITGRVKPTCTKAHLKILQRSLDNNTVYCGICEQPINEKEMIGKSIVINKNQTSYLKKWFHYDCCIQKNIEIITISEQQQQQNKELLN